MTLSLILIAVVLIGAGGVFAAVEAAIVTLPVAEIREIAEDHPKQRNRLLAIAAQPREHANTAAFERVLSEMGAAVVVTIALVNALPNMVLALIVAIVAMTLASFVLVGASPRTFGINRPEKVLVRTARLISISRIVIGPIAVSLSSYGRRTNRVAEADQDDDTQLMHLVDKAVERDVLEQGERELIHQVVEFGDTLTRSIMIPRIDMRTLDTTTTLDDAMDVFLESGYSRLPLQDEETEDVVGVVYLRDVARALFEQDAAREGQRTVEFLARRPNLVPESKPIDDLLALMQRTRRHMWIVIDEYGSVAGLVTLEDVIEELVGEISDEHDRNASEVIRLAPHRYRLSARLALDELGDLFDEEFEDDEVDTVGGLLIKALGHLPALNERVVVGDLSLTAARIDPRSHRLLTVIAEPAAGATASTNRPQTTETTLERAQSQRGASDTERDRS